LFVFQPPLVVAFLILLVSGLFDSYQIAASAAFVRAAPPGQRSQAFGIAQGGMSLGQGAAMVLAGAAAQHYNPSLVVAAAGIVGVCAAIVVTVSRIRAVKSHRGG
jgi:MFS family permease